jgi:hypothetical protein
VAIGEFVPNWRITTIACIVPVVIGKICFSNSISVQFSHLNCLWIVTETQTIAISRPDSANEKLQWCYNFDDVICIFKRYFYACICSGDPSFSGLEIWQPSSRENKVNFTVDVVIAGQKLLLWLEDVLSFLQCYVPQSNLLCSTPFGKSIPSFLGPLSLIYAYKFQLH